MNENGVFFTILSGVFVFVVSQLIAERIIKPRTELKKIIGKTICYLTMHARYVVNPLNGVEDNSYDFDIYWNASCDLRLIASELSGQIESYPFVCNKEKYKKVVNCLIRISNEMVIRNSKRDVLDNIIKSGEEICKILKIENIF